MPSRGDYPPLAGRAECTYAFREALVRIWQEVALAREDASRLRLGAFEIRRYQSQLWWIKSVAGQSETIVPWQTWLQPLELPAGLEVYSLLREAIFALRVQTKRSACVSKRRDCCILSGATVDVS